MASHRTVFIGMGAAVALISVAACSSSSSGTAATSAGSGAQSSAAPATLQWGNAEQVPASRAGAPSIGKAPASVTAACAPDKSPKIQAIKSAGVLHWGIGVSPPFGFSAKTGNWQGVEAENAVELAGILGVKPDIIAYDYSVMTTALQQNKADIVGAQLFDTAERRKVIDFSEPYYKSGQIYYVLKSSTYQTIADLDKADVNFVYGTGGAQGDLAKKYTPNAPQQQVPLQGQLIPYQFLSTNRAQSTMGESAAWPVLQQKFTNPPLAAIGKQGRVTSDLPTEADMLDPFNVAFGLANNDAGWKACVNAWVGWGASGSNPLKERVDYWLRHQTEAAG